MLVHHGLFWEKEPRVVGPVMRERLRALFDADLSLVAYHLALDAHPEVGNNALLCEELGVVQDGRFADGLGFGGRLTSPAPVSDLAERVQERLGRMPLVFSYGPEVVERVAVCSGGAARYLAQAAAEGYDCFVTGEADEPTKHAAKEAGVHFIAGGHYATETLGVRALTAKLAERFELAWDFVDLEPRREPPSFSSRAGRCRRPARPPGRRRRSSSSRASRRRRSRSTTPPRA